MKKEVFPVIYHQSEGMRLSYIASVVDEKGFFYMYHCNSRKSHQKSYLYFNMGFRVVTTNKEILLFLSEAFNLSRLPYQMKKIHWSKTVWSWQINGESLDSFLTKIFPYLILQKEICSLMIEARKTFEGTTRGSPVPDHIYRKRLKLAASIQDLRKNVYTGTKHKTILEKSLDKERFQSNLTKKKDN